MFLLTVHFLGLMLILIPATSTFCSSTSSALGQQKSQHRGDFQVRLRGRLAFSCFVFLKI